jgi:formylglycine-generating enzyme required for sulfatase activity
MADFASALQGVLQNSTEVIRQTPIPEEADPEGATRMACPGCGRQLRVKKELQGRKLKCPTCETRITLREEAALPTTETHVEKGFEFTQVAPRRRPKRQKATSSGLYVIVGGVLAAALIAGLFILRPWHKSSGPPGPTGMQRAPKLVEKSNPPGTPVAPEIPQPPGERPALTRAPFSSGEAVQFQKAWANYLGRPVEDRVDLGGGVQMELLLIPPGTFLMGSDENEEGGYSDEGPRHEVEISQPFYLGKYLVTQEQYRQVTGANPSTFQGMRNPVDSVTWDEARLFCETISKRIGKAMLLPSEAEWEYACRAGTQTAYYYGNDARQLVEYAWFSDNSSKTTHPVGSRKANPWGLFDMHGHVRQWCLDGERKYDKAPKKDPLGPLTGVPHILRGGSWYSEPLFCRAAYRDTAAVNDRNYGFGFRALVRVGPRNP